MSFSVLWILLLLHRGAAGRDAETCPGLGGGPCLRVSSVVVNVIQRGPGVCFSHGQERDQFPKVDRAFSLLGLWHWSFAAGDSLCSLRLPHSVKRADVRARCFIRPAAAEAGRVNMLEENKSESKPTEMAGATRSAEI